MTRKEELSWMDMLRQPAPAAASPKASVQIKAPAPQSTLSQKELSAGSNSGQVVSKSVSTPALPTVSKEPVPPVSVSQKVPNGDATTTAPPIKNPMLTTSNGNTNTTAPSSGAGLSSMGWADALYATKSEPAKPAGAAAAGGQPTAEQSWMEFLNNTNDNSSMNWMEALRRPMPAPAASSDGAKVTNYLKNTIGKSPSRKDVGDLGTYFGVDSKRKGDDDDSTEQEQEGSRVKKEKAPVANAPMAPRITKPVLPEPQELREEGAILVLENNTYVVRAATPEKLVETLTSEARSDLPFTNTFMLTFRAFLSPLNLFQLLMKRFNLPAPNTTHPSEIEHWRARVSTPTRLRVFIVMKMWVTFHWMDFEKDPELLALMRELPRKFRDVGMVNPADMLLKLLEKKAQPITGPTWGGGNELISVSTPPSPKPMLTLATWPAVRPEFTKLPPEELARQLTLIEHDLFRVIPPWELLGMGWMKSDKTARAPNILANISRFNYVAQWVTSEVVSATSLKDCQATIEHMIRLMEECYNLQNYCIDGNTPVTLASGVSMRIKDLAACPEVLALGPNGTFVPATMSAHLIQGQKQCLELFFRDGRKLVCTPDHKIKTTDGWCRADALVPGESRVVLGLEAPLYDPAEDDPAHLAAFKLMLNGKTLRMLDPQGVARAHALARILGFLYTDGSASERDIGILILGHAIDAEQAANDIETVTGRRMNISPPMKEKNYYSIVLPASLVHALQDNPRIRVPIGKRVAQAYDMPAVVTDGNAPKSFVREFLGTLFGGDGGIPVPSGGSWTTVTFCMSKEESVRDSIPLFYAQLATLLARFGIYDVSTRDWESITNRHANSVYPPGRVVWRRRFALAVKEIVPFQERVGIRYCAHKQQRLAVTAAYYRAKNYSLKQAVALAAAVDLKTGFSTAIGPDGKKSRGPKMPVAEAYRQAVKELEESEVVIDRDIAIPGLSMIRNVLGGDGVLENLGSCVGITSRNFIDEVGATEFFSASDDDDAHDINNAEMCWITQRSLCFDDNANASHHKVCYGLSRQLDGFPTWMTTFMGAKPAGVRVVYDITVPQKHNFLAMGIMVHNCSTLEIISGLEQTPVWRLKEVWSNINPKLRKSLEEKAKKFRSDKNWKKHRKLVQTAIPPCIPYLGMYLTDLVFADEIPKEREGYVNFDKYRILARIIHELQLHQRTLYSLESLPFVRTWWTSLRMIDENTAYERSYTLIPRGGTQRAERRGSNSLAIRKATPPAPTERVPSEHSPSVTYAQLRNTFPIMVKETILALFPPEKFTFSSWRAIDTHGVVYGWSDEVEIYLAQNDTDTVVIHAAMNATKADIFAVEQQVRLYDISAGDKRYVRASIIALVAALDVSVVAEEKGIEMILVKELSVAEDVELTPTAYVDTLARQSETVVSPRGYSSLPQFFATCSFGEEAANYTKLFQRECILPEDLPFLSMEVLTEMGVKMGHAMKMMKIIQSLARD